jgi:DNA-binding response OmpR family regulator
LPIIALTACATCEDQDQIRAAGMDDQVVKPVDRTTLLTVLERWLPREPAPSPVATPEAVPFDSTPVTDLASIIEELDQLLPTLRACKPKLGKAILERLNRARLPPQAAEKIRQLHHLIDHYEFTPALHLAEALREEMEKLSQ